MVFKATNCLGKKFLPSIVSFGDEEILVGDPALTYHDLSSVLYGWFNASTYYLLCNLLKIQNDFLDGNLWITCQLRRIAYFGHSTWIQEM